MPLQFMYGPASIDHLEGIADKVIELQQNNAHKPVYYLVPNHIKFQSEIQLLQKLRKKKDVKGHLFAEKDVQILSISRLAWFFLRNSSIYQYPRITSSSSNMLLYRVILEHQDELILFHNIDAQLGLVQKIARQLTEFKQGNVGPDELNQIVEKIAENSETGMDIRAKLHDLSIIYSAYEEEVQSRFIDASDITRTLTDELGKMDLSGQSFIISGFSNFTAEELCLIQALMKSNGNVVIDLVMDQFPTHENVSENSLFFENEKIVFKIDAWAHENGIKREAPLRLDHVRVNQDIQKLEKYWIDSTEGKLSNNKQDSNACISVFQSNSRYAEVEHVATLIRQKMAQDASLKFSDFSILTRHLSDYSTIIKPIFEQMELPIFYDLQIAMKDHPLLELINALFDINARHFRYEDVMRLLKTGLLYPEAEEDPYGVDFLKSVHITENYVLKQGIYGKQWLQKQDWKYSRFNDIDEEKQTDEEREINQRINIVKNYVADTVTPFFNQLSTATNGVEAAKALYDFLIKNRIDQCLLHWRDQWIEEGQLAKAAEPEQTWETFVQMLDEFVDILGDQPFDSTNFMGLLNAGFEGATYSQIPSTLDQILVSESGMVQMVDRKIVFIMGATDRAMPEQIQDNDFLNQDGKSQIDPFLNDEQFLSISNERQMRQEPYLNYLTFMIGADELIFSYPRSGNDGADFKLSPYVERIKEHFGIEVQTLPSRPTVELPIIEPFIGSKRSTLSHLIQYARAMNEEKQEADVRWNIIYTLLKNSELSTLTDQLLSSLKYKNIPEKLTPKIVEGLYGDTIYASVSKLEEFYRNEYSYFLKYGLKLQERETSDLSPADTGQYFHAAMDKLIKMITADNLNFNEVNQDQIDQVAKQLVQQMEQEQQFEQFNGTYRMGYLRKQLDHTVRAMVEAIFKQLARTRMRPIASEQLFGQIGSQTGLPALNFKVDGNKAINVRGKIDRIDKVEIGDEEYLGIVDYKSSNRKFDFTDAYYGLAMQMLMYLDVVQQNRDQIDPGTEAKISSALYMIFQDPLLKSKEWKENDPDQLSQSLFKKFSLNGFLLNDEELLKEIDKTVEDTRKSDVFPIAFTTKGALSKTSQNSILSEAELQNLIKHAELKVREAGKRIFEGELDLNPVQWPNRKTVMEYSPYKEIMQFDAMLPENNYRMLKKLDKDEVLKQIEEEQEK
jgi:ATP-dependent helicase/nuclease subunit B